MSDEAIDATHALRTPLAEDTMLPVVRELWIDRVCLALGSLLVVLVLLALAGPRSAAITAGVIVALFVVYELAVPKPDIRTYDSAPLTVLRLFEIHGVRAICMGHTHRPFATFTDAGLYANSGSWCPAFHDRECTKPVLDGRPVLWLTTEGEDLSGGLFWWRKGTFIPDPDSSRPAPKAAS